MLAHLLVAEFGPSKAQMNRSEGDDLYAIAQDGTRKLVDSNRDGQPEILLQAYDIHLCGARGNCDLWIYTRVANGFRKILDSRGPDGYGRIELVKLQPQGRAGYRDIVLANHLSSSEKGLSLWHYRGGRYKVVGEDWACGGKHGSFRTPKLVQRSLSNCSHAD